jgi:hypothetical protein
VIRLAEVDGSLEAARSRLCFDSRDNASRKLKPQTHTKQSCFAVISRFKIALAARVSPRLEISYLQMIGLRKRPLPD